MRSRSRTRPCGSSRPATSSPRSLPTAAGGAGAGRGPRGPPRRAAGSGRHRRDGSGGSGGSADGSGGPMGGGGGRPDMVSGASGTAKMRDYGDKKPVWKLVDNKPQMVLIKPGLTDGSSTEMLVV